MSDMAKSARAAMRAKAQRLAGGDPKAKVDASSWTPPEMMNTGAKTGMRPLTPRAYKRGGKTVGYCEGGMAKKHAGKSPRMARKDGGRIPEKPSFISDLINRNDKKANMYRPGGGAHVGGMKRGGRAHKMDGGPMSPAGVAQYTPNRRLNMTGPGAMTPGLKRGGKVHMDAPADKKLIKKALRQHDEHMHGGKHEDIKLKKGGRTHKQYGGSDGEYGSIDELMRAKGIGPYAPRRETAPRDDDMTNPFTGEPRTGGSAKYSNYDTDAESQAALKNAWLKQSKPEYATSQPVPKSEKRGGRTARASGGSMSAREAAAYDRRINDILLDHPPARGFASSDDRYAPDDYRTSQDKMPRTSPDPDPAAMRDLRRGGYDAMLNVNPQESGYRKGGKIGVSEKGGNYTGGTRPIGGRTARASGGRAKGKTTVNVIIAGGDKGLGMGAQAGQRPVAPPMAPPPMPPMPPMAPPAGGPPDMAPPSMAGGPPPMMRKAGGRVYRSYKDMDAGSGSGLGRLEKMEIQKHARR